jgi:hypothetical protein
MKIREGEQPFALCADGLNTKFFSCRKTGDLDFCKYLRRDFKDSDNTRFSAWSPVTFALASISLEP